MAKQKLLFERAICESCGTTWSSEDPEEVGRSENGAFWAPVMMQSASSKKCPACKSEAVVLQINKRWERPFETKELRLARFIRYVNAAQEVRRNGLPSSTVTAEIASRVGPIQLPISKLFTVPSRPVRTGKEQKLAIRDGLWRFGHFAESWFDCGSDGLTWVERYPKESQQVEKTLGQLRQFFVPIRTGLALTWGWKKNRVAVSYRTRVQRHMDQLFADVIRESPNDLKSLRVCKDAYCPAYFAPTKRRTDYCTTKCSNRETSRNAKSTGENLKRERRLQRLAKAIQAYVGTYGRDDLFMNEEWKADVIKEDKASQSIIKLNYDPKTDDDELSLWWFSHFMNPKSQLRRAIDGCDKCRLLAKSILDDLAIGKRSRVA